MGILSACLCVVCLCKALYTRLSACMSWRGSGEVREVSVYMPVCLSVFIRLFLFSLVLCLILS